MISSTTAMAMPSSGGEPLGIRHMSDAEVDAVNGGLILEAVVAAGATWFFDNYGSSIASAVGDAWDWFTGLF
jgi:hypothetical protein